VELVGIDPFVVAVELLHMGQQVMFVKQTSTSSNFTWLFRFKINSNFITSDDIYYLRKAIREA